MNLLPARLLITIAGASLSLLAACGGGSGAAAPVPDPGTGGGTGAPPSSVPEPTPPPPVFRVSGEVFSFQTGMIGNADVNLWVQRDSFGYSYWWANGPLRSDALGLFQAEVPNSDISILAFKDGFVQPCAVRSNVTADTELRVEMIPVLALNSLDPPRPQTSTEPSVTGYVFEIGVSDVYPVSGAYIWAENSLELGYANTFSDPGGGFYLCNLPQDTELVVTKNGFKPYRIGPLDTSQPLVLEIELERE